MCVKNSGISGIKRYQTSSSSLARATTLFGVGVHAFWFISMWWNSWHCLLFPKGEPFPLGFVEEQSCWVMKRFSVRCLLPRGLEPRPVDCLPTHKAGLLLLTSKAWWCDSFAITWDVAHFTLSNMDIAASKSQWEKAQDEMEIMLMCRVKGH